MTLTITIVALTLYAILMTLVYYVYRKETKLMEKAVKGEINPFDLLEGSELTKEILELYSKWATTQTNINFLESEKKELKKEVKTLKSKNTKLRNLVKDKNERVQDLEDEVAPIRLTVKRGRKPKKV